MARREKPPLAELEAKLGYAFRDADLAARALTHLSAQTAGTQGRLGCYERLEFLGDRVLGLAVAQMLYEAYPQASEGELSMRLAMLVRRETCAEIAQQCGGVRPAGTQFFFHEFKIGADKSQVEHGLTSLTDAREQDAVPDQHGGSRGINAPAMNGQQSKAFRPGPCYPQTISLTGVVSPDPPSPSCRPARGSKQ